MTELEDRYTTLQEQFFRLQEQTKKDAGEVNALRLAVMALPFLIKDQTEFIDIVKKVSKQLMVDSPHGEDAIVLGIVSGALLNYVPGVFK